MSKDQTEPTDSAACSTASTLEDIKQSCDKWRELKRTDVPDVYVMTTAAFKLIRQELGLSNHVTRHADMAPTMSSLIGISIEHYETLDKVHSRCAKLIEDGKRVALVCQ